MIERDGKTERSGSKGDWECY